MKIIWVPLTLCTICVTSFGQSTDSRHAESKTKPFTLTISVNPPNRTMDDTSDRAIKIGSSLFVRIHKTNVSDHEIPKWTSLWFRYDVRDGSGQTVALKNSGQIQYQSGGEDIIVGEKGLAPGESKIIFERLTGYRFNPPGPYTIQVSEHISDDPASPVVKSNVITITVAPADTPPSASK